MYRNAKRVIVLIPILVCAFLSLGAASRSFNSTDYISYPSITNTTISTEDFALAAWVKTSNNQFDIIMCKCTASDAGGQCCNGNNDDESYRMQINGTGDLGCYIADNSTGFAEAVSTGYNDGNWHFVVCNFDRSGNLDVYIDDMSSTAASSSITAQNASLNNDGAFELGRRNAGAGTNNYDGILAYPKMWKSKLLNEAERKQLLYCINGTQEGLQFDSYLTLVNASGELIDYSVNQNHGTDSGTTTSSDGPPVSWCGGNQ